MDQIIDFICSYFDLDNKKDFRTAKAVVGTLLMSFVIFIATILLNDSYDYPKVQNPSSDASFFKTFYVVKNAWVLIRFVIYVTITVLTLKYFFALCIDFIRRARHPKFKDIDHSILSMMTPLVEDYFELHIDIIKYLRKHTTAKDLSVVHLWLYNNSLICSEEKKAFLEAMQTDKDYIDVPAQGTFCDAEADISRYLRIYDAEHKAEELKEEEYRYVLKYQYLDKVWKKHIKVM